MNYQSNNEFMGINSDKDFVSEIKSQMRLGTKFNKIALEKLALKYDISDKNEVKEYTELAITLEAREIARGRGTVKEKFEKIVDLYKSQVNLSHRTSQSILLQQYSTPAPIGYLAGIFCGIDKFNHKEQIAFEPSAGNGLLTIAADPKVFYVNEIDSVRNRNLATQGFEQVYQVDATKDFTKTVNPKWTRIMDAVITNPPFGTLDSPVSYGNYKIKTLDHLMALKVLDTMKDNGKAAIIIGGHTHWDNKGRIQAGKNLQFFNYLYRHYYVEDIINIDGDLYSRQGTSFKVRLILISGRKIVPSGAAPLWNMQLGSLEKSFENLFHRVMDNSREDDELMELEAIAMKMKLKLVEYGDLGAPYKPASDSCTVLDTVVPDSMEYETNQALMQIKDAVGGDMDNFVRDRLGYKSKMELCRALSAEQIDAVALAIYNIEARNQSMVIGDQTGIGKGRVAASLIRYAVKRGLQPVFLTEKANLFSDIYRDLAAIGSAHLVPFIVNGKESKTDIKDEDGNIIYQALSLPEQRTIFNDRKVSEKYNFVLATYSQFNSPEKKPEKPEFLRTITEGNVLIMDESHNASGLSNTGAFMQGIVAQAEGVLFLSATFAKRPDNMPVYAMKTSITDANMNKEELVAAIMKGGVALQEVLASQLVAEGQMIRRERSFEGVEVNYITLEDKEQEHKAIADNITDTLRQIIAFQEKYIDEVVDELDSIVAAEGKLADKRKGTSQAGVDNQPYFSKIFNVINQMLFSIKADAVAERVIQRLKEGKKPVVAFASTMGSFIETMENEKGLAVSDGDVINADFSEVLKRGLDGVLRYTITGAEGEKEYKSFSLDELSPEAQNKYLQISEGIKKISTGITISPIDVVVRKIKEAGYSVAEVTGRKYELQINPKTNMGMVKQRKRINTNDAFRQFNNNEIDVLLINQSGSTGASAHAIITPKVTREQIKQRVMIVLQAELDINTEVQKRGRINRTGQIYKPIYDYVNSAIPAEKRLMMMLQKKLKSLDANTTSNQKQSTKILDVPDFLNKYGDKIVIEYLNENPEINELLGDPLKMEEVESEGDPLENAAHKVSGRVAVLSTTMQQEFYNEISTRYNEYVEYLKQIDEYDLEVEALDLQAQTLESRVIKEGKGGESSFGENSILEKAEVNVLRKPFSVIEVDNLLTESLKGLTPEQHQQETMGEYQRFMEEKIKNELKENEHHYKELIADAPNSKKLKKLLEQEGDKAYREALKDSIKQLEEAGKKAAEMMERMHRNRKQYLDSVFNFFFVGRNLFFPYQTFDQGQELVPAISLGIQVDKRKKNPYAPSALRIRIAIAGSSKYLSMPLSYQKEVNSIIGVSSELRSHNREYTLKRWEESIKERNQNRGIRYIITGNLLQAYSDYNGKLVSYTTMQGEVKKGILLPEHWQPDKMDSIVVPVGKALKIIRSMGQGSQLNLSGEIGLFRHGSDFKIIVSSSRSRGGEIYLEPDVLQLVDKNNFNKVSDKMVAFVRFENIDKLVMVLQKKLNVSVTLSPLQYQLVQEETSVHPGTKNVRKFPRLQVNSQESEEDEDDIELMEMEAQAIIMKLKLLKYAA